MRVTFARKIMGSPFVVLPVCMRRNVYNKWSAVSASLLFLGTIAVLRAVSTDSPEMHTPAVALSSLNENAHPVAGDAKTAAARKAADTQLKRRTDHRPGSPARSASRGNSVRPEARKLSHAGAATATNLEPAPQSVEELLHRIEKLTAELRVHAHDVSVDTAPPANALPVDVASLQLHRHLRRLAANMTGPIRLAHAARAAAAALLSQSTHASTTAQLPTFQESVASERSTDPRTDARVRNDHYHSGDPILPDVSTQRCAMHTDGFEVCHYENICVDLPTASESEPNSVNPIEEVLFVSTNRLPGTWAAANLYVIAHAKDERAQTDFSRLAPYADEQFYIPEVIESFWKHGAMQRGFDNVFEDIRERDVMKERRVLPFGTRLKPRTISPAETISSEFGGDFDGDVTWVDDAYVVHNILDHHLWGFSASVGAPLLTTLFLNASNALTLPPLNNLVIAGSELAKVLSYKELLQRKALLTDWASGFLNEVLTFAAGGAAPFVGKSHEHDFLPEVTVLQYPAFASLLQALGSVAPPEQRQSPRRVQNTTAAAQHDDGAAGEWAQRRFVKGELPKVLPYDMFTLANRRAGTRVIYNVADIPRPPTADALAGSQRSGAKKARLCMKRGVIVGEKPILVGGAAEANAYRHFGHAQLGIKTHVEFWRLFPPKRVAIFNRVTDVAAYGKRTFENLDEMVAVVRKYVDDVTVIDDTQLQDKSFAEQADLLGSFGVYIMAHGAGETNLLFAPRRATVIEVFPYGMWCPIYTRMATNLGFAVFPIYSHMMGNGATFDYSFGKGHFQSKQLAEECHYLPLIQAADSDCWHEFKVAAVYTPIHEFERTLLDALDVAGIRRKPKNAAIELLHGVAQEGEWIYRHEPGIYENRSWSVCERCTECRAK